MNYEFHITIDTRGYSSIRLENLVIFTENLGYKITTIHLDSGEYPKQIMVTGIHESKSKFEDIKVEIRRIAILYYKAGHKPIRIKVEIHYKGNAVEGAVYYEAHILYQFPLGHDYQKDIFLKVLREAIDAHVSKSAKEVQKFEARFITIRDKDYKAFENKLDLYYDIDSHLRHNSEIFVPCRMKEEVEVALWDTNMSIDKGWLYASGRSREAI